MENLKILEKIIDLLEIISFKLDNKEYEKIMLKIAKIIDAILEKFIRDFKIKI